MTRSSMLLAALLTATGSVAAEGAFNSADDAIQYRQHAFQLIKENFGDMHAMLKGKKAMDSDAFQRRAKHLALLANIPFEAFKVAGSNQGDTEALASVWSDNAKFNRIAKEFQQASSELARVSAGGDVDAIGQAFGTTGKSCKGCHDQFKRD
ncbi:cytochrome c [Ferrimonas sediminicola]|uniref:Cytochrome c n=1 Tax=Ferrimonas sediminicola TaxID=2569538 RepID=A0A4U1BE87_9GAMM|nr:cytochrome c [Ferrimonas sediminicola]TKB49346.1 cytochrome c [Ferrimonas sediminicola]